MGFNLINKIQPVERQRTALLNGVQQREAAVTPEILFYVQLADELPEASR